MAIKRFFVSVLVLLFFVNIANGFSANSSNYRLFPITISSGSETVNSSTYKSSVTTGVIGGVVNSSSYKNLIGFFYSWLLGTGQPCTANSQCEGGYCCSNICQATACPAQQAAAAAGGGGEVSAAGAGGAGFVLPTEEVSDFSISKDATTVKLKLGEAKTESIVITNTGNTELSFSLSVAGVNEYMAVSESSFSLGVGESKSVSLDFIGKSVGSFTGSIAVKGNDIEKGIGISLEVESKIVLFDVKIDIPSAYKTVSPGESLRAQITLLNVGVPELVDVIAAYFIKDLSGNIIYQSSETFAVTTQKSFVKEFPIPEHLKEGKYVAVIELRYADSFAVSSEFFEVREKEMAEIARTTKSKLVISILIIILIGMLFIFTAYLFPKEKIIIKK